MGITEGDGECIGVPETCSEREYQKGDNGALGKLDTEVLLAKTPVLLQTLIGRRQYRLLRQQVYLVRYQPKFASADQARTSTRPPTVDGLSGEGDMTKARQQNLSPI